MTKEKIAFSPSKSSDSVFAQSFRAVDAPKKIKTPPTLYIKGVGQDEFFWLKTKAAKHRLTMRDVLNLVLKNAKTHDKQIDAALRSISK